MRHEQDLADQDLEEVAEELVNLAEDGRDRLDDLRRETSVTELDRALRELAARGCIRLEGGRVRLTPEGRALGERQVRRHRLAELLFTAVLEVRDDWAVNRTACVIEHVLDANMTDSVCAFLGHPKRCPHGKPIPEGPCCAEFSRPLAPLVQPLERLAVGGEGRIVYIVPREPGMLVKLSSLGIVPGAVFHLQQVRPAVVLRVGETTLAVEPEIAGEIYVKPLA